MSAQVRIYQQGSADLSLTQFDASGGFGAGSLNPFLVCDVLIFIIIIFFSILFAPPVLSASFQPVLGP